MIGKRSARVLILLFAFVAQACSTPGDLVTARTQFQYGSANQALQTLDEASVSRRDTLLLLMDKALVAQAAGKYQQSIAALEASYQLVDELDYVSARDQTSALFTNDWAIRYSGEYSERLWIHTFQMINYLLTGQPGGAAVEARRAVKLFEEHADVLNADFFTRYLMAISFEAAGQFDSASVEYRKLAKLLSTPMGELATKSDRELVLIVASGFIAPKLPGDLYIDINARIAFPFYPAIETPAPSITITANTDSLNNSVVEKSRVDTQLLPVARQSLEKRGTTLAARQAIRIASKYAIAEQLESQDEVIGQLARILFFAIEQADTRSWETLPSYLSLIRVPLPEKATSVQVHIQSFDRIRSGQMNQTVNVTVNDQRKQFKLLRVGIERDNTALASP